MDITALFECMFWDRAGPRYKQNAQLWIAVLHQVNAAYV